MSKITVTTIAGQTSGSDANLVKIESGDTLQALSNATVGGTLIVTGATTLSSNVAVNGGTGGQVAVNYTTASTTGLKLNDTNSGNLGGFIDFRSGSGAGTQRATIQNANNAGIHVNVGTGGSLSFGTGYTSANALDDYEEGTWTATAGTGAGTVSSGAGVYTKIGRVVYVSAYLVYTGASTSGNRTYGGLPFPVLNHISASSVDFQGNAWSNQSAGLLYFDGGTTNFVNNHQKNFQGSFTANDYTRVQGFYFTT